MKREFERVMFEMVPPPPDNSLILYQGDRFTLSCDHYSDLLPRKFLTTVPCTARLRVLQLNGRAEFYCYRLPASVEMSVLQVEAKPELVEMIDLSDKNARASFAANDIIELRGAGSMVMLTLRENSMSPFTWAFDSASLTPLFITVSDQSYNRWKMLIELVVKFHGTAYASIYSSDLLMQLGDHELHYLRWSACQALAKIDLATAGQLVGRLITDSHSHVRRAAAKAMERIDALKANVQE
ncbi:HEAT repeat domain-containing protein [Sphingomonas sp. PB1R3]|uniref:HEAT repeat domain-containing protein n=1 Tax=Sphingomonas flavida TaxID=3096154 RepID=UPI002FC6A110